MATHYAEPERKASTMNQRTKDKTPGPSKPSPASSAPASVDLVRMLVESVKDYAIITLDPQGNVLSWNPAAERLKGYRASEIVGQHFSRFYTPEDLRDGK